jgi:hypothetical protein
LRGQTEKAISRQAADERGNGICYRGSMVEQRIRNERLHFLSKPLKTARCNGRGAGIKLKTDFGVVFTTCLPLIGSSGETGEK